MPKDQKHFSKTKPMKLEHFAPVVQWRNNRIEDPSEDFPYSRKYTASELINEFKCNLDICGFPQKEEEVLDPVDLVQKYEEQRLTLNQQIDDVLDEIMKSLGGKSE